MSAHLHPEATPISSLDLSGQFGETRSAAQVLEELVSGGVEAGSQAFPTGFDPLDRVLEGGFETGDLALVGGLPGAGKTVCTLQWARHMALAGRDTVYVCYEHSERSLLGRLVQLEAGEAGHGIEVAADLRSLVRDVTSGRVPVSYGLRDHDFRHAFELVQRYATRLWLIRASGVYTGLEDLERFAAERLAGGGVLFVDYLQKVAISNASVDDISLVTRITEGLKEIALKHEITVVAVVAADRTALSTRRLRLHQLRGSSALAYEADVAVLLNRKFDAVSKVHTAHDPVRAEGFKREVVFTIEKNRDGPAPLNLEFSTDFEHFRFDPHGGFVQERLIDDRLYPE